jgi:hypothetical protein
MGKTTRAASLGQIEAVLLRFSSKAMIASSSA